jgi:hypothetical protein
VDNDKYCAAFRYSWKGGEAGVLGGIGRDTTNRPAGNNKALFYTLIPYAIAQIGPVKIQTEADYFWGKWQEFDLGAGDVKLDNLAAWIDATADFGKFYAGGTFAYLSGDDPGTTDKMEGNAFLNNGGRDWDPCLILFNYDRTYWAGNIAGHDTAVNGSPMTNAWFFQGRLGVRPIDKLDIMASVSYANADKKPSAAWLYNDYGYEVDLTATYKITNNLSYMLGIGYLFTGDFFKGYNTPGQSNETVDNYLLVNKLVLTF